MVKKKEKKFYKQDKITKDFVQTATEIIERDGIEAVTIRKVSSLVGYTSGSLYNYFDNLSHLIFLANMNFTEEYHEALPKYTACCKNSIEIYMAVCKCFSEFAYSKPEVYQLLFFSHANEEFEKYTSQYYNLYTEKDEEKLPEPLGKMFHLNDIYSRSFTMLEECIKDGFIEKEKAIDFNEICLRLNKTILEDVKDGFLKKEKAVQMTLKYYYQLFGFYLKPEYKNLLEEYYKKIT